MAWHLSPEIEILLKKGVKIDVPESVAIGGEVKLDRISGDGVVFYPGTRLYGNKTFILKGTKLGQEGPVTMENCQLGQGVELKGGYFRNSVFLDNVTVASGAHVREGSILEEESSAAHMVGLKQTILFPFVTLGSLINFCDCLMAGGTSRKDHSEVGSSYIHFNYTPNQDKATPSLLGDVPRGVMLNHKPIFLGGQGGMVGPCRLAFGTVIAAGSICRKDQPTPGRLMIEGGLKSADIPFTPGLYHSVKRIVINNITFIANLMALEQWYRHVRCQFISKDFPEPVLEGMQEKLSLAVEERIKRLVELAEKMPASAAAYRKKVTEKASDLLLRQKRELYDRRKDIEALFKEKDSATTDSTSILRDLFLEKINSGIVHTGRHYLAVIQSLEAEDAQAGTRWLNGVVEHFTSRAIEMLPAFGLLND